MTADAARGDHENIRRLAWGEEKSWIKKTTD
jgi:hypothetical protein